MFAEIRSLGYSFLPMDAAEKASLKSLPHSTAIMSKSVSQRAWIAAEALHQRTELWNNWWGSEEPFWAMGNAHRLCGNEGSKRQAPQASGLSHTPRWRRWKEGHTGGQKSCGTQEGRLKRRFSKTWCPLTCEKGFCWWH